MGRLTPEVGTDSAVPASEAQEGKRLLLMRNGTSATASEQPCGLAGSSTANPSAASEAQELAETHERRLIYADPGSRMLHVRPRSSPQVGGSLSLRQGKDEQSIMGSA